MDKRGAEDLLMNVIYLTIIGLLLVMFVVWISGMATGKTTKAEMMSKEIALTIDSAKPYSEISINHEGNLTLDTKNQEVSVKIEQIEFSYDYFSSYKVSFQEVNETFAVIKIEK